MLPFLYSNGYDDSIRTPKLVLFVALAGLIGAYLCSRRFSLSLGANFGLCVVSGCYSGLGASFQLANLAFLSAGLVSCYLIANLESSDIKRILICLIIAGIGNAAMGYMQMMDRDPIFFYEPGVLRALPSGFLGQQTLVGVFLSSAVVAALFCRWYIAAIFILPVVVGTQSSFSYLALGAGFFIWILYQFGRRAAIFMFLGGLAFVGSGLLCRQDWTLVCKPEWELFNPGMRFENWYYIFWYAMKAPFLGTGFGTYAGLYQNIQPQELANLTGRYDKAHNDLLQHFLETGVVGLSLFLWLFVDVCRRVWENRGNPMIVGCFAILITYLANSLGNFPFRLVPQGVIALWAAVIVMTYKEPSWHN